MNKIEWEIEAAQDRSEETARRRLAGWSEEELLKLLPPIESDKEDGA